VERKVHNYIKRLCSVVDKNVHRKLLAIWKTSKKEESKEEQENYNISQQYFLMSLTFDIGL